MLRRGRHVPHPQDEKGTSVLRAALVTTCVATVTAAAVLSGSLLHGDGHASRRSATTEISPMPRDTDVARVLSAPATSTPTPTPTASPLTVPPSLPTPQPTTTSAPSNAASTVPAPRTGGKPFTPGTSPSRRTPSAAPSTPTTSTPRRTSAPSTPTPRATPPPSAEPEPSTPGRKVHQGDLTITTAGTVIDNWEITGVVRVKAANVTIRNSLVRGLTTPSSGRALVSNWDGHPGLVVEDTTIREDKRSSYNGAGVQGYNFTLRRVHIIGGVDNVQIYGPNVLIESSVLENTSYYASHYSQGGGATHNDNVQILKGDNIRIVGNTIRGSQNFAVLGAPEQGPMRGLVVRRNRVDDGHCTMKFATKGGYPQDVRVTENVVGRDAAVKNCGIVVVRGVNLLASSGNTWADSSSPVAITWTNS